ncbi:BTAD domain-containing putative transcriptional regulator [Lentzea sp. NPDC006480]|uniref:BTAD domain-containing putative transcriptional regulator n=1 Tax=Lentzea sp. NPDC006480 TaxID=3157176 RepID=UPI0033BD4B97
MRFRVLGPLEVVDDDQVIALGGSRQRATLGFLLLHANRVVASSELIGALWPGGKAPASARKVLQNSVWRLRGALCLNEDATGSVALESRAPGYLLRVDPGQTDLHTFQRLVCEGRAELAAGSVQAATRSLADALALWRGPALADLVETGIDWPALMSLQNARLDALEDYFDAKLACGDHHQLLAELERAVVAEPLRERLRGQWMLALYRCGRQTDALDAYHSLRTTLVDKLGLEPGHALQALQQAILGHDPALVPADMRRQIELRTIGAPVLTVVPDPEPELELESEPFEAPEPAPKLAVAPPMRTMVVERKDVSVLIVRTAVNLETDPQRIDEIVETTATIINDEVECLGGTVAASIGSIWLAIFGLAGHSADEAEHAVQAALHIRDRLSVLAGAPENGEGRGVAVHVAVTTGEALVRHQPGGVPSVSGALVDECHSLLSLTSAGDVRVCETTSKATEFAITYHRGDTLNGWLAGGFRQEYTALHAVPVIDREYDLEVLRGLLQRTRYLATPHLVTVLGEPGIGKTRFILEFQRRVAASPEAVRVLVGRIQPFTGKAPLAVLGGLLASYCGVLQPAAPETAVAKLTATVQRLVGSGAEGRRLLQCLTPLVETGEAGRVSVPDVLAAWQSLLGRIVETGPVVVVFEDLHCADDALVEFVENLATSVGAGPLLVIATARPELLKRHREWGGGTPHGLALTLGPISDAAIDRLLEFLVSTSDSGVADSGELLGALLADIGAEPDVRRSQLRRILASGSAALRDDRCNGEVCTMPVAR